MKNSLNNLTDGTIIYGDSNIFIYDATNDPDFGRVDWIKVWEPGNK